MKLFYDCEFLEDGYAIYLISIGMVDENGRKLYAVNADIKANDNLYDKIRSHKWLMENVVPHLPLNRKSSGKPDMSMSGIATDRGHFNLDMQSTHVLPKWVIRNMVREFILSTPDVELWADYAAYDHVCLAQLFGTMIQLPEGCPMFTHEFQQYKKLAPADLKIPKLIGTPEHHALGDAKKLKHEYEWVKGIYSSE